MPRDAVGLQLLLDPGESIERRLRPILAWVAENGTEAWRLDWLEALGQEGERWSDVVGRERGAAVSAQTLLDVIDGGQVIELEARTQLAGGTVVVEVRDNTTLWVTGDRVAIPWHLVGPHRLDPLLLPLLDGEP